MGQAAAAVHNRSNLNGQPPLGPSGLPLQHSLSHQSAGPHNLPFAQQLGTSGVGAYRPLGFNRAEEESESEPEDESDEETDEEEHDVDDQDEDEDDEE